MGYQKDKEKDNRMIRNSLILILQLGLNMIVPILICTGAGILISKHAGNKNIIIICIIVGIVAGFNGVYKMVKVYLKEEESPGQRARRLEEELKNDNKMD